MQQLLQLFIWIPLIGLAISTLLPPKREKPIALTAIYTAGAQLLGLVLFSIYWLSQSFPLLDSKHIVFFKSDNIEIFIDFYFDKVTLVFSLIGAGIFFLVMIFSRYYLHREAGFKRYFYANLVFFLGYNLIVFSGNFETLFIGWEFLGISSFLLITFFRDRYLPVKNGFKVISIYRLSDIFLILAMWMSHHLWHENITFMELNDLALVNSHIQEHSWYGVFVAMMIVLAASIKSAQLPFSSWLPRAMEGPTTSSAVFYGSLSVHMGVFLLLRTFPYWEGIPLVRIALFVIGLLTFILTYFISRVQSTVKSQIAYASVSHIGLIFVEIALGFHLLALFHFGGNALLRTYQLLVSPSVLGYRIHDMFFNFMKAVPGKNKMPTSSYFQKLKNSLYILSLKEWDMDFMQRTVLWGPFKWLGKKFEFLNQGISVLVLIILLNLGIYSEVYRSAIPPDIYYLIPLFFSVLGLILILRAFVERGDALWAWGFILGGIFSITISIMLLNEDFGQNHILWYLSGTLVSALVGFFALWNIRKLDNDIRLDKFHGYSHNQSTTGLVFLLSCLGLIGLPFTPAFIGIDILFSHIHKHQELIIVCTALSFAFLELAVLRIYLRIFLGQNKKNDHAMAYRSS